MKAKVVIVQENIHAYHIALLNALKKRCENMFVLYAAANQKIRWWQIDRNVIKYDYEVLYEGMIERAGALTCLINTWRKLNALNPDVVIIGGWSRIVYWASFFWAKINKKKIILWSESNEMDKSRPFLKEWVKSIIVSRCDAANTHGESGKEYLVELGLQKEKVRIMGAITDNDYYREESLKLKGDRENFCREHGLSHRNFLFLGRFAPEKNIYHLLDAYKRLKNNACDWGLILAGSGPDERKIKEYLKRYAINGANMSGFLDTKNVARYFSVSDVFILPSICEPWGMVVGEAMSAGLPVLVSKKCGCALELVKEGVNGFSFDPYKEDELFRRMEEMASGKHDLDAMGKASQDIIKEHTPRRAAEIVSKTIDLVSTPRAVYGDEQ